MTIDIPTIELRVTAETIVAGVPTSNALGQTVHNNGSCDVGIATAFIYDIYENGAPMADGRTFVVPRVPSSSILKAGPIDAVISRQFLSANLPVTYTRGTDLLTVFSVFDPFYIAFFKGTFAIDENFDQPSGGGGFPIPWGQVPVFMLAANADTAVLNYFASDAYGPWCLVSTAATVGSGIVPTACGVAPADLDHTFDSRPSCLQQYPIISYPNPRPCGGAGATAACEPVDLATARSSGQNRYDDAAPFPDLRCYRTADSHATLDWAGRWPTWLT